MTDGTKRCILNALSKCVPYKGVAAGEGDHIKGDYCIQTFYFLIL